MSPRIYSYVGPSEIAAQARRGEHCIALASRADLAGWMERQTGNRRQAVVATFVVTRDGVLRVADRHSEHVACAGGEAVRAAGELTFDWDGKTPYVAEATNQSTGYCPEPECWDAVKHALDCLRVEHPGGWTNSFVFRKCEHCSTTNIVKDDEFACAVCATELPRDWNFPRRD